ncbi:MAG: translation initiation factor IF-3 [Marinilabiliaceae bacterium]|nr:translation initiation factor IF-3 [Marinilabiliaceae bacterium]
MLLIKIGGKAIAAPRKKPGGRPGYNRGNRYSRGPVKEELHKINNRITARAVRVVGENIETQILSIEEAIRLADEMELDLVEISPNADPPVCKITDYQKFLYQQKKKQKESKAKTTKVVVKEIRFGPNTDDHDYNFKLKHAVKFLEEGSKVKAYVFFKGRTILFKEKGEILLLRLATDLEEYGTVEQMPKLEGKRMIMHFAPKKKKK